MKGSERHVPSAAADARHQHQAPPAPGADAQHEHQAPPAPGAASSPRPASPPGPPFATATIARLYMLQGKLEQAEAIYRQLLEERPREVRLLEGLAEVQRRLQARLEPPAGDDRLELVWERGRIRCRYTVTADGQRRAGLLLGCSGTLVLRLHAFPSSPGEGPIDRPLERPAGELELTAPEKASVVAAAVGLTGPGDRFVAIAHCCTASA